MSAESQKQTCIILTTRSTGYSDGRQQSRARRRFYVMNFPQAVYLWIHRF
jgi:hypothetical protein